MNYLRLIILFFLVIFNNLSAQCPEFESTSIILTCLPSCDLCVGDQLTINLKGNDLPNGGRIVNYIVPAIFPCVSDTSEIRIIIVKQLSAGLDTLINLCSIDSVNLNNLLRNADPGGTFTDQAGKIISSKIYGKDFGFGQYNFYYNIGDGISCPKTFSTLTIRFKQTTIVDPITNIITCNYYVLPPITGLNTFNKSSYYSLAGRRGILFNGGDTIWKNTKLFATGNDINYCSNEVSFNITIGTENKIQITEVNKCPDYFRIVGGTRFDRFNSTGTIRASASNIKECDTLYTVNLSFLPDNIHNIDSTMCEGGFLTVNGKRYDKTNSVGIEKIIGGSSALCDSTIFVNLSFRPLQVLLVESSLCPEDSLIINGIVYNANHSTGQEVTKNSFGCDEILKVNLNILSEARFSFLRTICLNDSIRFGNVLLNSNNPTYLDTLKNASLTGCDSIVDLRLNFYPPSKNFYAPLLCPEEFLQINNTRYDVTNPKGVEILKSLGSHGCDSIVDIQLSFYPKSQSNYVAQLCPGQFIIVNNHRYDELNPSGIEVLKNESSHFCDSIVSIQLQFGKSIVNKITQTICLGDSILLGNKFYSKDRTQGIDTLKSTSGCDSIIDISLFLIKPSNSSIKQTLCIGESIIINGETYDESRRKGIEVLKGLAVNGCDSIISIELDFADPKIKVTSEFIVNLGSTVQITATPDFIPFQIKWEPETNLSCSYCLNPISSPTEDIEYTLTLIDSNGCEVISRIKILVINDINIYVPNVFSPNNDNLNDRFEIFANSTDLIINNYNIYDRWGELVYSISNTPLVNFKAWDGRFNSEYVNPGVYTYYIKISTKAGFEKTIHGDVTLLR